MLVQDIPDRGRSGYEINGGGIRRLNLAPAACFGSFEIDTFPWSQSRVQVCTFYSFTFKVSFWCTKDVLRSLALCETTRSDQDQEMLSR